MFNVRRYKRKLALLCVLCACLTYLYSEQKDTVSWIIQPLKKRSFDILERGMQTSTSDNKTLGYEQQMAVRNLNLTTENAVASATKLNTSMDNVTSIENNIRLAGSKMNTSESKVQSSMSDIRSPGSKGNSSQSNPGTSSNHQQRIQLPDVSTKINLSDSEFINILPWHKRWSGDRVRYWYTEGLGPGVFAKCPQPRCRLVSNLSSSDAVLIAHKFLMDLNATYLKDFKLPPFRHPRQKWIFVSNEPPQYRPVAKRYLRLFNGTFTYRADSDAHYPYGHVIERPSPPGRTAANGKITKSKNIYHYPKKRDPYWSKKKDVVWIASNCHAKSKRELYVKELSKYINITIIGDCGQRMKCRRSERNYYNLNCYKGIENNYKFYLAFENSLCKDYGTEKFWRTLQQNMIPVVYGLYNYTQNAPHKSFIDVRDFESPKKLAEYLKKLSSDRDLYESYMSWKKTKAVLTNPFRRATCQLCEYLHKTRNDPPRTVDLATIWGAETNCINPDHLLQSIGVHVQ